VSDFTLPELGENIAAGDVLRVLVKPGDTLTKEQPVLELETDKATIEVPSSVEGRVKEVKVKAGEKVKVGQVILSVEDGDAKAAADDDAPGPAAAKSAKETEEEPPAPPASKKRSTGSKSGSDPRGAKRELAEKDIEPEGGAAPAAADAAEDDEEPADAENAEEAATKREKASGTARPEPRTEAAARSRSSAQSTASAPPATEKVVDISRGTRPAADQAAPQEPVAPAAPSVRRMARELGVNIDDVTGSGAQGRISVEDVKDHAKRLVTNAGRSAAGSGAAPLPDFSRFGEIERQTMRSVRRKTAEHLSAAWTTIPHVTQHDLADVTALEELRKRYGPQVEAAGGNLTVTAIAVKVVAAALKVFPQFNASIDLAADEIILKKYVHIGVAVDTDRGLLVPVVRDADQKSIMQIAVEIGQLSEKARSRKIALDEMQGGCFSISNLGGIGGTAFSPIVNAPEVAILGISRARMEPVFDKARDTFVPRLMLPLSLSYDHRVIDGADGIRFLRWVIEALEQPFLLALRG
jgi:pyruvate dehydrogenase E2 component (dihydrolipoamide acetyltransferase)